MSTFNLTDGFPIHYVERGAGQPLVFLPGWAMTTAIFQKQIEGLSDCYRVIAVDPRGQGDSRQTEGEGKIPTLKLFAQDLRELMHGLDLYDVVLVGWSMGALIMWDYYDQFGPERLAGMIVLEMVGNLGAPDWAPQENESLQQDAVKHVRSFVSSMFAEPLSEADLDWISGEALKTSVPIAQHLNLEVAYADARPMLPKIRIPTLIIYGGVPLFFTDEQERETIQGIPNVRARFFEKSKHCPFWEEPGRCNSEIRNFVEGLKTG